MSRPKNIAFFGASVTEQSVHHATKERTGYVNYFQDELAPGHGFQVSRVAAGSSDIMDAGVVYVEKIITLKPDVCVLDWVTPALTDCDPRIVQQIYYRLMEHDILPVTVLLPRKDRVQKEIPIAQEMARICEEFGLPFHDMADHLEGVDLETILRDTVHTNAEGAEHYAKALLEILLATDMPSEPLPKRRPAFHVFTVDSGGNIPIAARKVEISLRETPVKPIEFSLVLEQRVGPYSPMLDVFVEDPEGQGDSVRLETFPVFDAWCKRERECIKRITNWHKLDNLSRLRLQVGAFNPGIAKDLEVDNITPAERHLKPRGTFYIIADKVALATAKWS